LIAEAQGLRLRIAEVSGDSTSLRSPDSRTGRLRRRKLGSDDFGRVAQHITASPDGLDVVLAARRLRQFLAQLQMKTSMIFSSGSSMPPVEMVGEHLLGQGRPLAQAQQLDDAVFLGGQVQRMVVDRDDAAVEVDQELAGADRRFGMPFERRTIRMDAGAISSRRSNGLVRKSSAAEAKALIL